MVKRKIMIVLEDTDDGNGFTITLEGDSERILSKDMHNYELSAAELWSIKLFNLCVGILQRAKMIKKPDPKTEPIRQTNG